MDLTGKVEYVSKIDLVMGGVYEDIAVYCISIDESAKFRCLSKTTTRMLYNKAVHLIKTKNPAWSYGLSNRAVKSLRANNVNSLDDLKCLINVLDVDLELLQGIGHKTACEIRTWILKKNNEQ